MPRCHKCQGAGQVRVKIAVARTCPECAGSKILANGEACPRCNKVGEIETGKYKYSRELCHTCWGDGQISQMAVNIWLAIRVVPTTIFIFGGGFALAWFVWLLVANVSLTATLLIITLATWGGLTFSFIGQLLQFGPISPINWLLVRSSIASIVLLGIGGAIIWILSEILVDARLLSLAILSVFAVWAIFIFFLIIFDTPKETDFDIYDD